jgi:hypothetical protein
MNPTLVIEPIFQAKALSINKGKCKARSHPVIINYE